MRATAPALAASPPPAVMLSAKRTVSLRDRVVRLGPGVAAREQQLALTRNGERAGAYGVSLQQSLHRGVETVELLHPRPGDRPPPRPRGNGRTRQQKVRHGGEQLQGAAAGRGMKLAHIRDRSSTMPIG